jgi:hypothetical protein
VRDILQLVQYTKHFGCAHIPASEMCIMASAALQVRGIAGARHERTLSPVALQALYRYAVLLSVILSTADRELSVQAGTCPCGVRVCTPQHTRRTIIFSTPQGRWRSSTHTQRLPRHRLSLMPAQNASQPVPSPHSSPRSEVIPATWVDRGMCRSGSLGLCACVAAHDNHTSKSRSDTDQCVKSSA